MTFFFKSNFCHFSPDFSFQIFHDLLGPFEIQNIPLVWVAFNHIWLWVFWLILISYGPYLSQDSVLDWNHSYRVPSIKTIGEKGRNLTQSYDESPYTNRKFKKKRKWQHKADTNIFNNTSIAHRNWDYQLEQLQPSNWWALPFHSPQTAMRLVWWVLPKWVPFNKVTEYIYVACIAIFLAISGCKMYIWHVVLGTRGCQIYLRHRHRDGNFTGTWKRKYIIVFATLHITVADR